MCFTPTRFGDDAEPPLIQFRPYLPETEFTPYEIGWRDQVRITVTHQFALLPGPGRLLARRANESVTPDRISPQILQQNSVYYIPLSATATVVPEGEKSVRPYVQQICQLAAANRFKVQSSKSNVESNLVRLGTLNLEP